MRLSYLPSIINNKRHIDLFISYGKTLGPEAIINAKLFWTLQSMVSYSKVYIICIA